MLSMPTTCQRDYFHFAISNVSPLPQGISISLYLKECAQFSHLFRDLPIRFPLGPARHKMAIIEVFAYARFRQV